MKIFISWSGEKSKRIAEELRKWIPAVIQAAKPYYTPDDITKGSRWSSEIAQILEECRIGLICLTPENLGSPWIMFESGALSKNIEKSKVVPILFGVEPTDIQGPLIQFQAARFEKSEIKRIIQMINSELGENKLSSDIVDSVFDMWWPKLEEQIKNILEQEHLSENISKRTEKDLLEEILMTVRSQAKRSTGDGINIEAGKDLVFHYARLVEVITSLGFYPEIFLNLKRLGKPIRYITRHTRDLDIQRELLATLEQTLASLEEVTSSEDNGK